MIRENKKEKPQPQEEWENLDDIITPVQAKMSELHLGHEIGFYVKGIGEKSILMTDTKDKEIATLIKLLNEYRKNLISEIRKEERERIINDLDATVRKRYKLTKPDLWLIEWMQKFYE